MTLSKTASLSRTRAFQAMRTKLSGRSRMLMRTGRSNKRPISLSWWRCLTTVIMSYKTMKRMANQTEKVQASIQDCRSHIPYKPPNRSKDLPVIFRGSWCPSTPSLNSRSTGKWLSWLRRWMSSLNGISLKSSSHSKSSRRLRMRARGHRAHQSRKIIESWTLSQPLISCWRRDKSWNNCSRGWRQPKQPSTISD